MDQRKNAGLTQCSKCGSSCSAAHNKTCPAKLVTQRCVTTCLGELIPTFMFQKHGKAKLGSYEV
jgi:hypothetical protein